MWWTRKVYGVQVLPLAFIAKSDEDAAVAALWSEIWEDGTTSLSAALRMYMSELVPLITAGTLPSAFCLLTIQGWWMLHSLQQHLHCYGQLVSTCS